jgi:CheY-like chemotaxis protein
MQVRKIKHIRAAYVLPKDASGDGPNQGPRFFLEAIMRSVNVERVLLVEQPNGRDMLKIGLEAAGFEVAVADDAETALTLATVLAPAVVIIEITLPTMDGWELARRLRQLFGSRMRLIALTSRGNPEDRDRTTAAGFDVHHRESGASIHDRADDPRLAGRVISGLPPWRLGRSQTRSCARSVGRRSRPERDTCKRLISGLIIWRATTREGLGRAAGPDDDKHRAMPHPVLLETDERRCPDYRYQRSAADSHVTGARGDDQGEPPV